MAISKATKALCHNYSLSNLSTELGDFNILFLKGSYAFKAFRWTITILCIKIVAFIGFYILENYMSFFYLSIFGHEHLYGNYKIHTRTLESNWTAEFHFCYNCVDFISGDECLLNLLVISDDHLYEINTLRIFCW